MKFISLIFNSKPELLNESSFLSVIFVASCNKKSGKKYWLKLIILMRIFHLCPEIQANEIQCAL